MTQAATEPAADNEGGPVESITLVEVYVEIQQAVDRIQRHGGQLNMDEFDLVRHYAGIIGETHSDYMRSIALKQMRRHLKLLGAVQ